VILVFAGRRPGSDAFPEENVGAVAEQARRVVPELQPRLAIGSAAAGADLLAAGAALEAGARVEVLLAGGRERFRAESVDDKGAPWPERFDRLLRSHAVEVTEVPRADDADASYRTVTAAIAERAEQLAEEGETVTLLALSSPRAGGIDHTEELVGAARARGWRVLRIDTAQPSAGSRPCR
jgi:hypothetical protein